MDSHDLRRIDDFPGRHTSAFNAKGNGYARGGGGSGGAGRLDGLSGSLWKETLAAGGTTVRIGTVSTPTSV